MFLALEKIGMAIELINMMKVLFQDSKASVWIIETTPKNFQSMEKCKVKMPFSNLPFHLGKGNVWLYDERHFE